MKICLVANVNLSSLQADEHEPAIDALVPPLGILTLASIAQDHGHSASILDFNYSIQSGEMPLDDDFYEAAAIAIAEQQADVVGFSTMCNALHVSLRIAQRVKQLAPDSITLFGGPQISFVDEQAMRAFPSIDMCLRGEADESLPLLMSALEAHRSLADVPGLSFRESGGLIRNADAPVVSQLDDIPDPAWNLFTEGTGGSPSSAASIDVGRGCPFSCDFCSTALFFQRRFRTKSYDRIIAEMWMLKENYGATSVTFMHDLFTANRKWVRGFCDRLGREKGLDLVWSASARIDTVDRELLQAMADVGCVALFYGVETGSPRLQRDIHKNLKIETVVPVADASLSVGIRPTLSFIAGFPTETADDLRQTLEMVGELFRRPEANIQLHLMSPQSGTSDLSRFADRLVLDEYCSDIAGSTRFFREQEWFRKYPALFPSFFHFDNPALPRRFLQGLDLFVRGPCRELRDTLCELTAGRDLFDVYTDWREWLDSEHRAVAMPNDETILEFYRFLKEGVDAERFDVNLNRARDEVLAFYFRHYHATDVCMASVPACVA